MIKFIKDTLLMISICKKYGIKLRHSFKRDKGTLWTHRYYDETVGFKLVCTLFGSNRLDIFFHEIGHHIYKKNKIDLRYRALERDCPEILSGLKQGEESVEAVLYEESFASAFSRRAMKSLGKTPDTASLKRFYSTYSSAVMVALCKYNLVDYLPSTVDIIYKAIRRIEGVSYDIHSNK